MTYAVSYESIKQNMIHEFICNTQLCSFNNSMPGWMFHVQCYQQPRLNLSRLKWRKNKIMFSLHQKEVCTLNTFLSDHGLGNIDI